MAAPVHAERVVEKPLEQAKVDESSQVERKVVVEDDVKALEKAKMRDRKRAGARASRQRGYVVSEVQDGESVRKKNSRKMKMGQVGR